jgi:hypothetical protein
MREKKNALVQSIIEISCKSDISQQAKEKAISNLIKNHIEEPLVDAASIWVCESFLEVRSGNSNYIQGYFEDIHETVEDLRRDMRTVMEE